jgi:energy-coupling factor transport system permease protein
MRVALAYAPRRGPLGSARPGVAALYLFPLAVIAFAFSNPLLLAAAGAGALVGAAGSGAMRASLGPLRFGLALAVMIVVVNVVVSQRGDTILLRGWELPLLGQVNVSGEALVEGLVLALRILVALVIFAVWSACVDPDRILKALRPLAGRSALTATLISRLVPLAAADAQRFARAAELRGPAAAPVGRAALARRLIAGSLDRSVDVAATLELRGYALGSRFARERPRRADGELPLALSGAGLLAATLAAALAGAGGFEAYPTVAIELDAATLAFAVAIPLLSAIPFLTPRELRARAAVRARDREELSDA